jgi:hypothetical protein
MEGVGRDKEIQQLSTDDGLFYHHSTWTEQLAKTWGFLFTLCHFFVRLEFQQIIDCNCLIFFYLFASTTYSGCLTLGLVFVKAADSTVIHSTTTEHDLRPRSIETNASHSPPFH